MILQVRELRGTLLDLEVHIEVAMKLTMRCQLVTDCRTILNLEALMIVDLKFHTSSRLTME